MYWKKRNLKYSILIPPIKKPFEKFSLIDTKNYFEWYLNQIDDRVHYLQEYSHVSLNYSVESLVYIWEWFLSVAEIEKTPKKKMKEIKKELKGQPKDIISNILNEQSKQFSLETEYIIRDIAMYFGEVYVQNNSSISWGYHTDVKRDSFANMPLLTGFEDRDFNPPFKAMFEPIFIVRGLACNIFDNDQKKEDLLDMYKIWQSMVFNE